MKIRALQNLNMDVLCSIICLFLFVVVLSGNRTPGSRSYSDLVLVDTWADSVCIHQLVLKPCLKSTSTMAYSS